MKRGPTLLARVLLVVLGAWSILPPFITPVDVARSVEVVDHVIPGAVVMVFGMIGVLETRSGAGDRALAFSATGICLLAGIWMTLTHITLWGDAGNPGHSWGAVVLHGTAGPLITLLAGWLMLRPSGAQ